MASMRRKTIDGDENAIREQDSMAQAEYRGACTVVSIVLSPPLSLKNMASEGVAKSELKLLDRSTENSVVFEYDYQLSQLVAAVERCKSSRLACSLSIALDSALCG
jgi:hypothetical protein